MPIKVWTSPLSWNCLRCELVLAEKGITDVERIPADLISGKHKTPEFTEKSLHGKVPLLEDDDVILCESRAICRYLCLKYTDISPSLIPDLVDPRSSAVWEMHLILEAIEFDAHVSPVIAETLIKPAMGKSADEAILERHRPKLDACLDVLDKSLSTRPFLGGEEFSLVDVSYMPCIYVASRRVEVFGERSHLKRWWERVSARRAWMEAVRGLDESWALVFPGWDRRPGDGDTGDEDEGRAHL